MKKVIVLIISVFFTVSAFGQGMYEITQKSLEEKQIELRLLNNDIKFDVLFVRTGGLNSILDSIYKDKCARYDKMIKIYTQYVTKVEALINENSMHLTVDENESLLESIEYIKLLIESAEGALNLLEVTLKYADN
mgnify:FL=1